MMIATGIRQYIGSKVMHINAHNSSILTIPYMFLAGLLCFGCAHAPRKYDTTLKSPDWKDNVKQVVFYLDEYPDWQAQETVTRKFFTIRSQQQIEFLVSGVDMVTKDDEIGISWLGGYLTSMDFIDDKGNVVKNVDIGRNGCIVFVRKYKRDSDSTRCYYNRPLCLAVYGFMEKYAAGELKDQRYLYEIGNKHMLEQRPAYPWDSLDYFDRIWTKEKRGF